MREMEQQSYEDILMINTNKALALVNNGAPQEFMKKVDKVRHKIINLLNFYGSESALLSSEANDLYTILLNDELNLLYEARDKNYLGKDD